jgi:hypothetical protein
VSTLRPFPIVNGGVPSGSWVLSIIVTAPGGQSTGWRAPA